MKVARSKRIAGLLAAALIVAGCAQDKPPEAAPGAAPVPQMVTDLSSVSGAAIDPLGTHAVPKRGEGLLHESSGDRSSPRTFGEEPGLSRSIGTDANPGEMRLLNDKAAKFANFCGKNRRDFPHQVADRYQAGDHHCDHGPQRQAH